MKTIEDYEDLADEIGAIKRGLRNANHITGTSDETALLVMVLVELREIRRQLSE